MKYPTALILVLFSTTTSAYQGMNMEGFDFEAMQNKMAEMAACMEKVDQAKIEQLQVNGEKIVKEVESLCAQGKRDAAQDRAVAYANTVRKSPELRQIRECGKIVAMAPNMPTEFNAYNDIDMNRHVCDP